MKQSKLKLLKTEINSDLIDLQNTLHQINSILEDASSQQAIPDVREKAALGSSYIAFITV